MSQFTIPDPAGTSPDSAWNYTDTRPSQPNQGSCTPDFSYMLVSSISYSSSSSISLILVHNSTIITEHEVKLSLSISPCHDHEFTSSTAYTEYNVHRVQHTPSTAYTEYNVHRVQHTPSTAYTQDSLSSLDSHDYELTPECCFSFQCTSLHDQLPLASSPWDLKGKGSLSHAHGCELTNWWQKPQHPAHRPSTASQYSSKVARLQPPSSYNYGLHVHLHTPSITTLECISKFTRSQALSVSPNTLDYGMQVYLQARLIMASNYISKLAWLRSLNKLHHGLQVYLQTHSITASKLAW